VTTQLSKPADALAVHPPPAAPAWPPPDWAGLSDRGCQRENNEDSWGAFALGAEPVPLEAAPAGWPEHGIVFVLSDGMGGARAGEEASRFCVQRLAAELHARRADADSGRAIRDAFLATHDALILLGRSNPDWKGLGATLSALWLLPDGAAVLGHVGDSRVYRLDGGRWLQWTEDHSLGEGLVRRGQMTAEAVTRFKYRSLLEQVMGGDGRTIEPQIERVPRRSAHAFALCSDGLYRPLERGLEARLTAAIQGPPLASGARTLIDAANSAGGPDNITVVLVRAPTLGGS
jgi:protein phosphatase